MARSRAGVFTLLTLSLLGCAADRVVSPTQAAVTSSSRAALPPQALERHVLVRPGPMIPERVKMMLGTPGSRADGWSSFEATFSRPAGSMQAEAAGAVASLRSAWTPVASATTEIASRDTIFGALNILMGGTTAEVVTASRGSWNTGAPTVKAFAWSKTYVGMAPANEQPAISCMDVSSCSVGRVYEVNCEATQGSRIESNSEHDGIWPSGLGGHGTLDKNVSCWPSNSPPAGTQSTGSQQCYTYYVYRWNEQSQLWILESYYYSCT